MPPRKEEAPLPPGGGFSDQDSTLHDGHAPPFKGGPGRVTWLWRLSTPLSPWRGVRGRSLLLL